MLNTLKHGAFKYLKEDQPSKKVSMCTALIKHNQDDKTGSGGLTVEQADQELKNIFNTNHKLKLQRQKAKVDKKVA